MGDEVERQTQNRRREPVRRPIELEDVAAQGQRIEGNKGGADAQESSPGTREVEFSPHDDPSGIEGRGGRDHHAQVRQGAQPGGIHG